MSIMKFVNDYAACISNLDSFGITELSTVPYSVMVDGEMTVYNNKDDLETFIIKTLKSYFSEKRYTTTGRVIEILYMGKYAASLVVEWSAERDLPEPSRYQIGYHLKRVQDEYGEYSEWKVCGGIKVD